MKDYIVGFSYTEFGRLQVRADSEEEAQSMVEKILYDYGMPDNARVLDREYSIDYSDEVAQ